MLGHDSYKDVPDRQIFTSLDNRSIEEGQHSLEIQPERNALSVAAHMPWSIVSVGHTLASAQLPLTGMFDQPLFFQQEAFRMLTDAQREKWQKDGYIRLERFFDPAAVEGMSSFVEDISRWDVSDDKWLMWFEKTTDDRKITSKAENFLDFHDPLRLLLLEDQRINSAVEDLLGEDSRRLKELLIFHYPDSGGYRPHQDIYHIPHKLPDRMVHAIVAIGIDDSDPDNGGLFFSPGNHKKGVFPMDAGGVIDPEVAETFSWEPVVWKAGDIFIFDDYAPHYSKPNKSNRSRRTLYLVFQRASTGGPTRAEYNVLKRALNPPEGKVADLDNLKLPNGIFYRD